MKLFAHNKQQEKPSPLSTELVKEFVVACHRNFDRTKEMLDCNAFTTEIKVNKSKNPGDPLQGSKLPLTGIKVVCNRNARVCSIELC